MFRYLYSIACLTLVSAVMADDPNQASTSQPAANQRIELSKEVQAILDPLFQSISDANVSRATVELLVDSLMAGKVVDSKEMTFQVAAAEGNKFTIYLREPQRRTRVYSNGSETVIALAGDAYTRMPATLTATDAIRSLPVPMGPYPEPLLALTLAGTDPSFSFIDGMKSIQWVDDDRFRGRVDAVHLRGVQKDEVVWDFWIATGDQPRPLRLQIDLTPMLRATSNLQVPDTFSYQLRYDFHSWRMDGELKGNLFDFRPPPGAREYASTEAYFRELAAKADRHPLLGKPLPAFTANRLDGETIASKNLAGKVLVIDLWATWCEPCVEILPVLKDVAEDFADKDVEFLPLNVGESKSEIETYLADHGFEFAALLDEDEKIADVLKAQTLPQTVVVGRDGMVESVHVGFVSPEALRQRMVDELEVLAIGGRIATAQ